VDYMLENTGCLFQEDPVLGVNPKVSMNATRSDPTIYSLCTPCYVVE
jgi:hypothetical protein